MKKENDIVVCCVPPDSVMSTWNSVAPMLIRGLSQVDTVSPQEVLVGLRDGIYLLWVVFRNYEVQGVFVTELVGDGEKPDFVCCFGLCGIGLRDWLPVAYDTIMTFAKREGCRAVRIASRDGWRRLFPDASVISADYNGWTVYERAVA